MRRIRRMRMRKRLMKMMTMMMIRIGWGCRKGWGWKRKGHDQDSEGGDHNFPISKAYKSFSFFPSQVEVSKNGVAMTIISVFLKTYHGEHHSYPGMGWNCKIEIESKHMCLLSCMTLNRTLTERTDCNVYNNTSQFLSFFEEKDYTGEQFRIFFEKKIKSYIKHRRQCFIGISELCKGSQKYNVLCSILDKIEGVWIVLMKHYLKWLFDISFQSKQKLRGKWRSKIVKSMLNKTRYSQLGLSLF